MSKARKNQQQLEDEALARALQLQFEREASAGGAIPSAPLSTSASFEGFSVAPHSLLAPPSPPVVIAIPVAEGRNGTASGEHHLEIGHSRERSRKNGKSHKGARKSSQGSPRGGIVSDQELARQLAIAQEEDARTRAAAASTRRSRSKTSSKPAARGFPAPEEHSPVDNPERYGYTYPVPPTRAVLPDDAEHSSHDQPHHEWSDEEYARRVEQELQDELVAERLQQREAERFNQLQRQQQQHRAVVAGRAISRPRQKSTCGSLICIALVVGAVFSLVYYFVILGGGIPDLNLTPEDFANEDPFDAVTPEEANSWKNNKEGITLTIINALETKWYQYFYDAIDDWDDGFPDSMTLSSVFHQGAGEGSHDYLCSAVAGQVKVCNGDYGDTRWKGINEVLIDGYGNIVASASRMNEFYLGGNDDDQMQYTMCHEMGHAWGLPHTDETFGNPDLGDCMDYTNNPKANRQPNERNFAFLWNMYGSVPGAAPYTPPTQAPTAYVAPAPSVVVAQNSTVGGNRRRVYEVSSQATVPDEKYSTIPTHGYTSLEQPVATESLEFGQPLPVWLSDAIHSVYDRSAGRRLRSSNWRITHSHSHGETHEIDLPQQYALRVHYLKAELAHGNSQV